MMITLRAKGLARTVECQDVSGASAPMRTLRSAGDFLRTPACREESRMRLNRRPPVILAATLLIALPTPALAYGGPGLGLGVISAVFGVLGAIVLGFIAILWYPFKRLIRRIRRAAPALRAKPDDSGTDLDP